MKKVYTYEEITKTSERIIKNFMSRSGTFKNQKEVPFHEAMALGAQLCWAAITHYSNRADERRLFDLVYEKEKERQNRCNGSAQTQSQGGESS